MFGLLLLTGLATAAGSQTLFDVDRHGASTTFEVAWVDANRQPNAVTFALPTKSIDADRNALTVLPRPDLYRSMADAVAHWSKGLPAGTTVVPKATEDEFSVSVRGPESKARAAFDEANQVALEAEAKWLAEHDATTLANGSIAFDHAPLAAKYASEVRPIAEALRRGTEDRRAYVEKALAFVQAIPYEPRASRDVDTGYRRPLGVIGHNKGDCDSKSVLFLALVRAVYPDVPLAFVYVPNHALVGLGLPPLEDDRSFVFDGVRYVYAEPVWPGLRPLGETRPEDRRAARKGEVRVVPRE
jgi:hypothetical protein